MRGRDWGVRGEGKGLGVRGEGVQGRRGNQHWRLSGGEGGETDTRP